MTTSSDTLAQAQRDLNEAWQQKREFQKTLETLKVMEDIPAKEVEALQDQIEAYERETIPTLKQAVTQEQVKASITGLVSGETDIMTDEQARTEAAALAYRHRLELELTKQKLGHNSQRVRELIEVLQQDRSGYSQGDVTFPSANEVIIHGQKYSTTGGDDLRFLATRAITLTWSN